MTWFGVICALSEMSQPLIHFAATYNILAIGDWGGQENSPYTTNNQLVTAHGLGEIAAQLDAHFIVGLGDNFYTNGAVDVALFAYFRDDAEVRAKC